MVSRRDGSGGVPTVPAHLPVTTFTPTPVRRRSGDPDLGPLPDWWALLHGDSNSSGLGYETASSPLSKAVLATDLLPWCYGQVRVSVPAIAYGTINPGSSTWAEGQALIPWSEGPIQSIDAVLCGGNQVQAGFANNGYQTFDRLDFTGIAGELNGYIGGYFDSTLGRLAVANRVAGTYFHVQITAGWVYANTGWWTAFGGAETGTLEFAADIHGLKLYDPRKDSTSVGYDVSLGVSSHRENDDSTWAYSTCPPLIARDLARRAARMDSSTIDDASIATAATASDAAGFSCSIAFTEKTTLENALAVVLQTCNGFVINANGKMGIFVDVANAGSPVASFSEEDGDVWDLNYEWLSARDRYTQMAVSFQNKDAAYKSDVTSWFGDPGTFSSEAAKIITGVNAGTDVITLASSPGWSVGDTVIFFQNGGAAIGGLTDGMTYYVLSCSGGDVTLSAVSGGAIVNLTGTPVLTTQYLQRIGALYPPTVIVRQQTVTAPGVNTMAAAVILRDYLFNSQAINFRISGTLNSRGILLQQGQKVRIETLKLAPADYLLQQITGDANGFFQAVVRPYSAGTYGSAPITSQPPVVIPPQNPQLAPADITVTDDTGTVQVAAGSTSNTQTFDLYQKIVFQLPASSPSAIATLVVRGFAGTGAGTKTWADMVASERQIAIAGNQPPPDATHSALIFDAVIKTVKTLTFDQFGRLKNTSTVTGPTRIIIKTATSAGTLSTGVTIDVASATTSVDETLTVLDIGRGVIVEQPSGLIDGTNKSYLLSKTPSSSRILLAMDGQVVVGGVDYTRAGPVVNIKGAANAPRASLLAVYPYGDIPDGHGSPEAPTIGTANTWTSGSIAVTAVDVAFSPLLGIFAAVAGGSDLTHIYTSPDGATWTAVAVTSSRWSGICWGNGRFVATSDNDTYTFATLTSVDGVTWTYNYQTVFPTTQGWGWNSVAWSDTLGLFAAAQSGNYASHNFATSPDGAAWTIRSSPGSFYARIVWSEARGIFYACGQSGGVTRCGATSADGATWSAGTPPHATDVTQGMVWVPELALFVVAATGIITSPDAATWTYQTSPALGATGVGGICWSQDRQILVAGGVDAGGANNVMTSPDAVTWTQRTSPAGHGVRCMAAGTAPDLVVGLGNTAAVIYSAS